MANVSDPSKRLKSLITSLQKILACPVCKESIKPPFKLCTRGHGVCFLCTMKTGKCPICHENFTLDSPIFVKNILETLPRLYYYSDDGCQVIVDPGHDHDMFCGYRSISCRQNLCLDKIPLNQLQNHYSKCHSQVLILKEQLTNVSCPINVKSKTSTNIPVFLFDNWFWIVIVNDTERQKLIICFQATPIGKLSRDHYAQVTTEKGKFTYTYTLKASLLSSCEENIGFNEGNNSRGNNLPDEQFCMEIPHSGLCYIVNGGSINFKYYFFQV